ncbi:hypothetical protein [Alkalihalobacterium alkalinitrilicum]|uniref:hypothetical protein n=1 Tax=Alkalihalobacterium alkalinitrilicum TaxID=427920 RepID=UPI000995B460|nr:hypothetical protein [Alkalihalobacterium alkalinitrilicum]
MTPSTDSLSLPPELLDGCLDILITPLQLLDSGIQNHFFVVGDDGGDTFTPSMDLVSLHETFKL